MTAAAAGGDPGAFRARVIKTRRWPAGAQRARRLRERQRTRRGTHIPVVDEQVSE